MSLVLMRKLNARNIQLHHDTRGETVGVLTRTGAYRYLPWLGFVERERAKHLGKPVRLLICRVGQQAEYGTDWVDVPDDKHVQGCLTHSGVYAVVERGIRLV